MSRILARIFVWVMLSMVFTGFALSFVMSDAIDRRFHDDPPKALSTTALMLRRSLGPLTPEEVRRYVDDVSLEMRSIRVEAAEDVVLPPGCRTPGRDWCWVRHPAKRLFGGIDAEIIIELPDQGLVLFIGPEELPSPLDLRSLLMLLAIILGVALVTGVVLSVPMVRRLRRMERAAAAIEQGDLSARADTTGAGDEINSMARQFNHMAARLQELIEGNVHLVQAVSHELRTPIARVRFSLEMLATAESVEEKEQRVARIENDLSALDGLIEELLLLIRYEGGSAALPMEDFDPEPPTRSGVARLAPMAGEKQLLVRVELDDNLLLHGSERSFERVVTNLVSNGLRYAASSVEVSLHQEGSEVILDVADDGPGVPTPSRDEVFKPFIRLDKSRSRDSGGVGLGLAIVARVMDAHRGSVEILDSSLGGALLRTRWPLTGHPVQRKAKRHMSA